MSSLFIFQMQRINYYASEKHSLLVTNTKLFFHLIITASALIYEEMSEENEDFSVLS